LLCRIARLYLDNKSWDNAFEVVRQILRKNRQNKEGREGMKLIYSAYLTDTDNFLKSNDAANAATSIEKAMKIAPNKKLIHKAVSIYRLLDNENKVYELEQTLKNMEKKEIQSNIEEKIRQAEEEESNGNLKAAIRFYEEAIKIDPQNSTLKKLIGLCSRIKRPDLAEKFTNWFNKYQHAVHEKEKAQAREAFKKNEPTGEESKQDEE
jgi:tetratricopeptide (TPR) repeat protein